jgi:hypothetical protein
MSLLRLQGFVFFPEKTQNRDKGDLMLFVRRKMSLRAFSVEALTGT